MAGKKRLTVQTLIDWALISVVIDIISLVCNWIGYDTGIVESLPGILIIAGICLMGMTLAALVPKVPAIVWVMLVGMFFGSTLFPWYQEVSDFVSKVQLNSMVPIVLAYGGVTVGKDWASFRRLGWRAIVVGCLAMLGTFVFSGLAAEIMSRIF